MRILIILFIFLNTCIANTGLANNYFDTFPFISYGSESTHNEITISFYTKKLEQPTLVYTKDGKTKVKIHTKASAHKHVFILKNLSQNTYYKYNIENIYTNNFHTSSKKFKEFKIVSMAHTGGTQPIDTYPLSLVSSFIEKLNPDFILHNGDLVWEPYLWEYKKFINDFNLLSGKYSIMVSPANHEIVWPWKKDNFEYKNFASFFKYPDNGLLYSFVYNNVQFISLPYYEDFSPNSKNMKKLETILKKEDCKYRVVYLGGGQNTWYKDRNIENIFPILKNNNIDLIIAGDSGLNYIKYVSGINYIFTGSNVRKLFPINFVEFNKNTIVFKQMTPDNKIIRSDSFFHIQDKKTVILTTKKIQKNGWTELNINNNINYGDSNIIVEAKVKAEINGQLIIKAVKYSSAVNVAPNNNILSYYFSLPNKLNPNKISLIFKNNFNDIKPSPISEIDIYKYNSKKYNLSIKGIDVKLNKEKNKLNFKIKNIGSSQLEVHGDRGAYLAWRIIDDHGRTIKKSKGKSSLFGLKVPGATWTQATYVDKKELKNGIYTLKVDFWHIGLKKWFEDLGSEPFIKKIKVENNK